MPQYEVDIAGIQEIRRIGHGILQRKDSRISYSCHKNKHQYGRGFIVTGKTREIIIDFRLVDGRFCVLRLKGRLHKYF
jgi:hypothetical protein